MTEKGNIMSPKERYLRSVLLNYQVCTDVVRHYFDELHPPTSLVQYLLDQRTKFEKEEKKIPNYQWIQLYPEVLFRADVYIEEKYIDSYDKKDLKDYKDFTDRISTIFTCLFDSVDGDQKVKVVNLSRLESGEVLATLEITSQYNPDDRIIKQALEATVKNGHVDASLETSPDGFSFAKQGDTYSMEIKLTKVNAAALALKDTKEFRIMAKRLERILLLLFDTVPGTQSVKVEEFRYLTSDCATAICKLKSENHKDEKRLKEAISIPTSEGRLGKTLKTICPHNEFSFNKVIIFEAEINLIEKYHKPLENSNSNEFKAFANRVQPIIKGLYNRMNSDTGEHDVEIVKCRHGPSDTVHVLFHLISHGNNDEDGLRAVTENEMLNKSPSLSYVITDDGFSFETNKCIFEVTLKLAEPYSDSKELLNPKSEAFKSLKEKVQPEILSLYDSVCGSQEIDILRYKSSGAEHSIIFNLTSIGCSDESKLKEPIETQIQTGLLGSSLKVSESGLTLQKLTERVFYQVSLNVKRQLTDELKKKHSGEFSAFSKFVQTVMNTHYKKVLGKQEINVVKCQQGPFGTVSTDIILEIISQGCADEVKLHQPIKDLITFGKLELTLKTSPTDFSFKTVRGSKPVSSECFDLSLLITLLRRDSNVRPPKNGFDVPPSKDDNSDGAQIATIKYYRNELAHVSEAQMDEHMFNEIWSNLENAIKHLGKADEKFMTAVNDALTMNLDSSTEILNRMVQHDRQVLQLEEDVTELYQKIEKLTKQTKEQSTSRQVEISEIKEDIGKKEEQILENKAKIQNLYTELHRVEKKFDEKFRAQDEINVQQDEINKDMGSGIQENRRGIQENRRDIQENRRDIQRLDTQNEARTNLIDQTESRITRFLEDTKETFVETKTQKKVTDLLIRRNCIVLVSGGGRGKTSLSLQIASYFRDKGYTPMYIVNNDIEKYRSDIDYTSKYFIIVDDLFGETNVSINDHILDVLRSSVLSKKCGSKVILNIRESPGCNQSILKSHTLFKDVDVINLDDRIYELNSNEKKKILFNHIKKNKISICYCKDYTDEGNGIISPECNGVKYLNNEGVYRISEDQPVKVCEWLMDLIIETETLEGFPEACHMFCCNETLTLQGLEYFKNTKECLVSTMRTLNADGFENMKKRYQYSILVYVAMNGEIELNKLNESLLRKILSYYQENDDNIKKTLVKTSTHEMSRNGKYLTKGSKNEMYVFQHATICEAVLISYGEDCPKEVLSTCSVDFILQYVWPTCCSDFAKPAQVYLFVPESVLADQILSRGNYFNMFLLGAYLRNICLECRNNQNEQVFISLIFSKMAFRSDDYCHLLDGLTNNGKCTVFVRNYSAYFTKMAKYASVAVTCKFCRPTGCLQENTVVVDDDVLMKQLFILLIGDAGNFPNDDAIDVYEYEEDEYIGSRRKQHQEMIGKYLHDMELERNPTSFCQMFLSKLTEWYRFDRIDPYIIKFLLDGLTDYGKLTDVISANYDFCQEYLFKYGSTPVVLALCRPFSYKGSEQDIVRVDNQMLSNKLIENLKSEPEDVAELEYKYVLIENYCYRPCQSNIKYFFFEDEGYFRMTYFDDIASYIYNYGVLENDEEFIETVTTAIDDFEYIEVEDFYTYASEQMNEPRDPIALCYDRRESLSEFFSRSTSVIRKMKTNCPSLLDSLSISYDIGELSSDSENSDTSKTDHEDDDTNEPETVVDVDFDGHDSYKYEESGIYEAEYNEDGEGNEKESEKQEGFHE